MACTEGHDDSGTTGSARHRCTAKPPLLRTTFDKLSTVKNHAVDLLGVDVLPDTCGKTMSDGQEKDRWQVAHSMVFFLGDGGCKVVVTCLHFVRS